MARPYLPTVVSPATRLSISNLISSTPARRPLALIAGMVSCTPQPTVVDVDQNAYPVVVVGEQTWLGANLRTRRDAEGRPLSTHAPNDDSTAVTRFGLLYDWVNAQRACLHGWRLPGDSDWTVLAAHLGPGAGAALKDTASWSAPNAGATNQSGFAARPAGYWSDGEFENRFGSIAVYWSATPRDTHFVWTRTLSSTHDSLGRAAQHPGFGLSIRCIKA